MNDYSLEKIISDASKQVPASVSMEHYLTVLRDAISSASTALESGNEPAAAMHVGRADETMKHVSAIWDVIMQRNG